MNLPRLMTMVLLFASAIVSFTAGAYTQTTVLLGVLVLLLDATPTRQWVADRIREDEVWKK